MISLARLLLDRAAVGIPVDVTTVPSFQWDIYWRELARLCPSTIQPRPAKQRNALRIEILPDSGPRCSRRSPDGRGLIWLLSGGDPLSYGVCCERACPRRTGGGAA